MPNAHAWAFPIKLISPSTSSPQTFDLSSLWTILICPSLQDLYYRCHVDFPLSMIITKQRRWIFWSRRWRSQRATLSTTPSVLRWLNFSYFTTDTSEQWSWCHFITGITKSHGYWFGFNCYELQLWHHAIVHKCWKTIKYIYVDVLKLFTVVRSHRIFSKINVYLVFSQTFSKDQPSLYYFIPTPKFSKHFSAVPCSHSDEKLSMANSIAKRQALHKTQFLQNFTLCQTCNIYYYSNYCFKVTLLFKFTLAQKPKAKFT